MEDERDHQIFKKARKKLALGAEVGVNTPLLSQSNRLYLSVYRLNFCFSIKGKSAFEGNVYVLNKPVCDNKWSANDAHVICKSLGCSPATLALAFKNNHFREDLFHGADFILYNVNCYGHEKHIGACDYLTNDKCGSRQLAGVRCIDPKNIELRGGLLSFFLI